ncbi:hypothetical protein ACTZWW_19760 [Salinarimonas sp. NSM]|uniref:hypothetical protein n=1 Tax=Salinarimonas TaxID=690086 RepID=UPI0003FF65F4|nr:hypothetical protein [Salinarimonas rosea]
MSHLYKVGQRVRLLRAPVPDGRFGGAESYEIVRLMPADQTGEASYRVKAGTSELAVRESEIQS